MMDNSRTSQHKLRAGNAIKSLARSFTDIKKTIPSSVSHMQGYAPSLRVNSFFAVGEIHVAIRRYGFIFPIGFEPLLRGGVTAGVGSYNLIDLKLVDSFIKNILNIMGIFSFPKTITMFFALFFANISLAKDVVKLSDEETGWFYLKGGEIPGEYWIDTKAHLCYFITASTTLVPCEDLAQGYPKTKAKMPWIK